MGPENQNHMFSKTTTKLRKEEKKKEVPKTGPRPASSMPIMQGFDAHSGRLPSDPIPTQSLSVATRSLTQKQNDLSLFDFPPPKQLKCFGKVLERSFLFKFYFGNQ